MNYLSVCSGIEAASVAWHPLGWNPVGFAEISAFPSAVLAARWPGVTNHGDFTTIPGRAGVDLLVGGTPCQSFSVAGLRGGLADERGNLALEYCRLADRLKPRWLVWENVPGVLSSGGGRDFGSILGALVELGYGFAYRVLDAQNFGVPQRRRRVFLVGYLGDWRRAAAVLFERQGVPGNPPARGDARAEVAGALTTGASVGGGWRLGPDEAAAWHAIPVPFDTTQITHRANRSRPEPGDPSPTLSKSAHAPAIAFNWQEARSFRAGPTTNPLTRSQTEAVAHALTCHQAKGGDPTTDNYAVDGYRVRRLTPRECERLQGFPDDYTLIPGASDSARYKALGNSMAVPCMRWIGRRIARAEAVARRHALAP